MKQQTAVEWLGIYITSLTDMNCDSILEKAKEIEREQIKQAVIYGLDEDGHTGAWKNSVAENYYIKTYTHENNS